MQRTTMWSRRPVTAALVLLVMLSVWACGAMQQADRDAPQQLNEGAAQAARVEYVVSVMQPQTQTVEVTMRVRRWGRDALLVALPVWRPGRYDVLDQAGNIRRISAATADGEPLPMRKTSKSQWRIETGTEHDIVVRYELFADSLRNRTLHVDDTHAFLSGESVFLYVDELLKRPVQVRIEAPQAWHVSTGLTPAEIDEGHGASFFTAADYHELIDCPLEIGAHDRLTFDVDGLPHEIVIWGDAMYDRQKLIDDFAAIVREQAAIFAGLPCERFIFQVHCGEGLGGGTEHRNSTIMQTTPARLEGSFENDDAYKRFLGLVSHEMFHAWNVKSFIPEGLVPYDYQRENYTTLLWLVEGTTSYYDDLTMARAELLTEKQYLKRIAEQYSGHMRRPGRHVQSLAESSYDAWIKYTQPSADSANSTISFYRKGALVSLMLDMEIRRRTGGDASLDDVMRLLYERFPRDSSGYTEADLREILRETAGSDFDTFFEKYVHGTTELAFSDALQFVGLELVRDGDNEDDGDDDGDDGRAADDDGAEPYLGVQLRGSEVQSVLIDGPANTAGIVVGDEIIAIDGRRLRGHLDAMLEHYEPGDQVEITLFRRDRMRSVRITLTEQPPQSWTIQRVDDPGDEQKAMYELWLHRPWETDSDLEQ